MMRPFWLQAMHEKTTLSISQSQILSFDKRTAVALSWNQLKTGFPEAV